jgi:hypothetical protein
MAKHIALSYHIAKRNSVADLGSRYLVTPYLLLTRAIES